MKGYGVKRPAAGASLRSLTLPARHSPSFIHHERIRSLCPSNPDCRTTQAMHYIVRHGVMRFLGDFEPAQEALYHRNEDVILETERGLEVGEALCELTPRALEYIEEPTKGRIV